MKTLTEKQASMLATAFIDGIINLEHGLCCSKDALKACAAIVGKHRAEELHGWIYDRLGCSQKFSGNEQWGLDLITLLMK